MEKLIEIITSKVGRSQVEAVRPKDHPTRLAKRTASEKPFRSFATAARADATTPR